MVTINHSTGQVIKLDKTNLENLWQKFTLNVDESLCINLDPLTLVIRHDQNEWSLAYNWQQESEQPLGLTRGKNNDFLNIQDNIQRYAYAKDSNILHIKPLLADRSIVARPRSPFYLVAKQNLWLYVSSPIWLEITIGEDETPLQEIPVHRPSDTWFGANTMEGEIAYATRTHARLSVDDINFNRHRALTPVKLINNTDNRLLLERISLPVPYLNLFQDGAGHIWTSPVTMMRETDNGTTSIKIESSPPEQIAMARPLAEPRKVTEQNVFVKTIQALFG